MMILSPKLNAKAISYPSGYTIMQRSYDHMSRVHLHYTSAVDTSLGVSMESDWKENTQNIYFQANHLLKRINTKTTQFNSYLKNQKDELYI